MSNDTNVKINIYLSTVGLHYHFEHLVSDITLKTNLQWCFLIISMIPPVCISLGLMPVLHIIKGEIFPTEIRTVSVGIVMATNHIPLIINMLVFPMATSSGLFHIACYVYSSFTLFMAVWAIITIKETDGMSLVEVEELYDKCHKDGENMPLLQTKTANGRE